jgi:nucleoside-diphosphate-sugar epimerase
VTELRVLVTGATGFVGYHTAVRLRAEGHSVRALARSPEKAERVLAPLGLEADAIAIGDMTDREAVVRAPEGCDAVVHAAAGVSVTTGRTDFDANLRGTETVVGESVARGLTTVFVSSLTAIFDPNGRVDDDSPLVRSRSHYGRSKAECDAFVRERADEGAPVAIVYPTGTVGPDDPGMSESVRAYRSFLRGTLASEGGNLMVDGRDLALLITRMLEAKARGRIVAAGHFFDWDAFTALIEAETGATIPRIRAPGWLLRGVARSFDVAAKVSGRSMPMTGEGVEIATRFRAIADSPRVAELGVAWRDPRETIRDLFRWFLETGRLPARAVPKLAAEAGNPAGDAARN